jgi:hypothetical protein
VPGDKSRLGSLQEKSKQKKSLRISVVLKRLTLGICHSKSKLKIMKNFRTF